VVAVSSGEGFLFAAYFLVQNAPIVTLAADSDYS